MQTDELTLKARAKNKNIKIHDSIADESQIANAILSDAMLYKDEQIKIEPIDEKQPPIAVGPANFTPLSLLGKGSFGEVYLVRDNATNELFAMKVLSKQKILGQNLVRYAKTERDVLSYTMHNFIVGLNSAF